MNQLQNKYISILYLLSIDEKNNRTQDTLIMVRRNDPRYLFKIAIGHKLIEKQSIASGTKGIDPHRASSKRELTRSTMYSTIYTELLCHETGVVGIVRNYCTEREYRLEPVRQQLNDHCEMMPVCSCSVTFNSSLCVCNFVFGGYQE